MREPFLTAVSKALSSYVFKLLSQAVFVHLGRQSQEMMRSRTSMGLKARRTFPVALTCKGILIRGEQRI